MKIEDNNLNKLFGKLARNTMPAEDKQDLLRFVEAAAQKELKAQTRKQQLLIAIALALLIAMLIVSVGKDLPQLIANLLHSLQFSFSIPKLDLNPTIVGIPAIICFYLSLDLWLSKRKGEKTAND